jgi:hypothetical protein
VLLSHHHNLKLLLLRLFRNHNLELLLLWLFHHLELWCWLPLLPHFYDEPWFLSLLLEP